MPDTAPEEQQNEPRWGEPKPNCARCKGTGVWMRGLTRMELHPEPCPCALIWPDEPASSSPPASDLAAAREDIEFILGGERFVDTPQLRESLRTLLSSLGDGDDSARLEDAMHRAYVAGYLEADASPDSYERIRARAEGFANHYVNARRNAARTAPGGASNAPR